MLPLTSTCLFSSYRNNRFAFIRTVVQPLRWNAQLLFAPRLWKWFHFSRFFFLFFFLNLFIWVQRCVISLPEVFVPINSIENWKSTETIRYIGIMIKNCERLLVILFAERKFVAEFILWRWRRVRKIGDGKFRRRNGFISHLTTNFVWLESRPAALQRSYIRTGILCECVLGTRVLIIHTYRKKAS